MMDSKRVYNPKIMMFEPQSTLQSSTRNPSNFAVLFTVVYPPTDHYRPKYSLGSVHSYLKTQRQRHFLPKYLYCINVLRSRLLPRSSMNQIGSSDGGDLLCASNSYPVGARIHDRTTTLTSRKDSDSLSVIQNTPRR